MVKYKAAVIGAGSIGALKDNVYDSPEDDTKILTHAHAYYSHPRIYLSCMIDSDIRKRNEAAIKWNCASISHLQLSYLDATNVDIISICTPTETHLKIVKDICSLERKPKVLIIEKPCGSNYQECEQIKNLCAQAGIEIIVPYIRRFIPEIRGAAAIIKQSKVYSCNIYYNRGLYRDGCHAIDFCNYLFGKFSKAILLNSDQISDYDEDDKTISAVLEYERCKNVIFNAIDGRIGSIFEADIITDFGRFSFVSNHSRINFYPIIQEEIYGPYKIFDDTPTSILTSLHMGLSFVVSNAIDIIENKGKEIGTIENALDVHRVISYIDVLRRNA